MNFERIDFLSSDQEHTIAAYLAKPEGKPKGIVQLAHGMRDFFLRYELLAEALVKAGYVFCGNDHLGHGYSVKDASEYGYFGKKDGHGFVVCDMHILSLKMKEQFPSLPLYLVGHSMGSFLARRYAVTYPRAVQGVVLLGTGGKNPLAGFGILLAKLIGLFKGGKHHSNFIKNLAFADYNEKFPGEASESAWLFRDEALLKIHDSEERSMFPFTVRGYHDLFVTHRMVNLENWFRYFPRRMPVLIVSGELDPVGNYGEGPKWVENMLYQAGVIDVELILYDNARHEVFLDDCKEEFFEDLISWLDAHV